MIASGIGLRSPNEPSLLALRTVVSGEKYRSVLVTTPIRGTRVVTTALASSDRSKELPPRTRMGPLENDFADASLGRRFDRGIVDAGRPIHASDGCTRATRARADVNNVMVFIWNRFNERYDVRCYCRCCCCGHEPQADCAMTRVMAGSQFT